MALESLTRPELIFPRLAATDGSAVLHELAAKLAEAGCVRDADKLYRLLLEREELGSTGIGSGVAVPHCKVKGLGRVLLAVGMTAKGIEFDSVDGRPVRLFFVLLSPLDKPAAHLQSLAAISRWVKDGDHLGRILDCGESEEIFEILQTDEASE